LRSFKLWREIYFRAVSVERAGLRIA